MALQEFHANTHTSGVVSPGQKPYRPAAPPSELLNDEDAWPPFLPSFSEDIVRSVDAFIDLFISQTIGFRCGQLVGDGFVNVFLPQWLNTALLRRRKLEHLLSVYSERLADAQTRTLFSALRKMQSATRDAEEELSRRHRRRDKGKNVSFTRPLAYRIARRSNDRLSVRTLPDCDDCFPNDSFTAQSPSPLLEHTADSPSPRSSYEPHIEFVAVADEDGEDRYTGRASGVFYGGVFTFADGEGNGREGRRSQVLPAGEQIDGVRHSWARPAVAAPQGTATSPDTRQGESEEDASSGERRMGELDMIVRGLGRRSGRGSARRLQWYLLTYWLLPMSLLVLAAVSLFGQLGGGLRPVDS